MQRKGNEKPLFTLDAGTLHNLLFTSTVGFLRDRLAGRTIELEGNLIEEIVKNVEGTLLEVGRLWPLPEEGRSIDPPGIAEIMKSVYVPNGRAVSKLEPEAIGRLAEFAIKECQGPFSDEIQAFAEIAQNRKGYPDTSSQLAALSNRVAAIEGRHFQDPADRAKANKLREVFNSSKDMHLSWIAQTSGESGGGEQAPAFVYIAWESLGIVACDTLGACIGVGVASIATAGVSSGAAVTAAGLDGNIF